MQIGLNTGIGHGAGKGAYFPFTVDFLTGYGRYPQSDGSTNEYDTIAAAISGGDIGTYSRTGAVLYHKLDNDFEEFATDALPLESRGLLYEGAKAMLTGYGTNPRSWTVSGAATANDTGGPYLAYFDNGVIVTAQGQNFHNIRTPDTASLSIGQTVCITTIVREGTSGRIRVVVRNNSSTNSAASFSGFDGTGAGNGNFGAGDLDPLSFENLGGGNWRVRTSFTADEVGSIRVQISPDTETGNVSVQACQVELSAYSSLLPNDTSSLPSRGAASLPFPTLPDGDWELWAKLYDGQIIDLSATLSGGWTPVPASINGYVHKFCGRPL